MKSFVALYASIHFILPSQLKYINKTCTTYIYLHDDCWYCLHVTCGTDVHVYIYDRDNAIKNL